MSNCILCNGRSKLVREISIYKVRVCQECGLLYSEPMQLPCSAETFFDSAYKAKFRNEGMNDIGIRIDFMRDIKNSPLQNLRGSQMQILKWLENNAPAGSRILDIGCGQGALLYALRAQGFHPVGLEPSADVVEQLKHEGLEIYQGTIENIPSQCSNFYAITMSLVLHHLVNPRSAIESVINHFPDSVLLVAEGNVSYIRKLTPYVLPPRALTLWSEKSLTTLLMNAGYEVEIAKSSRRPQEYGILPQTISVNLYRRLKCWPLTNSVFSLWLKGKAVVFGGVPSIENLVGAPPATLLAIGIPERRNLK